MLLERPDPVPDLAIGPLGFREPPQLCGLEAHLAIERDDHLIQRVPILPDRLGAVPKAAGLLASHPPKLDPRRRVVAVLAERQDSEDVAVNLAAEMLDGLFGGLVDDLAR